MLSLIRAPPLPAALAFSVLVLGTHLRTPPPHSHPRHPQGGPTNFLAKRALLEAVLGCFHFDSCFLLGEEGNEGPYSSSQVGTLS